MLTSRWINEQLYSNPSTDAVAMMKKDPKIFADVSLNISPSDLMLTYSIISHTELSRLHGHRRHFHT